MNFAQVVYFICAATSLACAVLLGRSYMRTRARLLLWASLCFAGMAFNNSLLFVDLVLIGPDISLVIPRTVCSFVGMSLLVYGLIMDSP